MWSKIAQIHLVALAHQMLSQLILITAKVSVHLLKLWLGQLVLNAKEEKLVTLI